MRFDTDIFINEISLHRPLSDITFWKDYSNRDVKLKLWIKVATIVIEGWENLPNKEKNKEGKFLLLFYYTWTYISPIYERQKKVYMKKVTVNGYRCNFLKLASVSVLDQS